MIGNAGSPSITLVATSAQDETAGETDEGGFGTNVLLDCIEGREFVQDIAPALDLIDIGRRMSAKVQEQAGVNQTPVVWGLNLYGAPAFCRNPRFDSDPSLPLHSVVRAWPVASDRPVKENVALLWECYAEVGGAWNRLKFINLLRKMLQPVDGDRTLVGRQGERILATFLQRSGDSADTFRSVEVSASVAVALLPYLDCPEVAESVRRVLRACNDALQTACDNLLRDLEVVPYALLAPGASSLSELYDLPIRVARVLAWAALLPALSPPEERDSATLLFRSLLGKLLEHYEGSIVALSDAQAPCWCIVLCQAASLNMRDEGEQIAGLVFNSLIRFKGTVARCDLPAPKVIEFLIARHRGDYSDVYELCERPAETLTVLLRAAAAYGLQECFDSGLWRLDGTHLLAFITDDYASFGLPFIEQGQNLLWTVGHDIFRTSDLMAKWPGVVRPPSESATQLLSLAALLMPDRVPWFLFCELQPPSHEDEVPRAFE